VVLAAGTQPYCESRRVGRYWLLACANLQAIGPARRHLRNVSVPAMVLSPYGVFYGVYADDLYLAVLRCCRLSCHARRCSAQGFDGAMLGVIRV
jgi:hypothetical protein